MSNCPTCGQWVPDPQQQNKRRPTIEELDAILNSEEDIPITIHPDGSITADRGN